MASMSPSRLSERSLALITDDFPRVQELVSAQPVAQGAPERVRCTGGRTAATPRRLTGKSQQHQEAQDPALPFAQRHRPQVPEKPQACAPRHCQGSGMNRPSARPPIPRSDMTNDPYRRSSRRARGRLLKFPLLFFGGARRLERGHIFGHDLYEGILGGVSFCTTNTRSAFRGVI
jgi:hypothetical protein